MSQIVGIDKKILIFSIIAASATIIVGVLHLSMVQRSFSREPLQGILFLVGGILQVFWAIPVIKQWGKVWQIIGIVGTAVFVLLWVFDRLHILPSVGMPPTGMPPGGGPPGNTGGGFMIGGQALPVEISQLVFIGFAIVLLAYKRTNWSERKMTLDKIFTKKLNLILVGIVVGLILVGLFAPISSQRGGPPQGQFGSQPNGFGSTQSQVMVQTGAANQTCTLTPSLIEIEDTPQQTEGPYFVDELLERSDIRSDQNTGLVEQGSPLRLQIHVYDVNNGTCVPLSGAHVDIWHANAFGLYSDIADIGTLGKTFLRGYQITDDEGQVQFTTVYPGWYEGRAIHIHIKVRTLEGTEKTLEWTSQFYLDDSTNEDVHKQSPYSNHGIPAIKNNDDGIYAGPSTDGMMQSNTGTHLMLNLTKDDLGYVGTFNVGLNAHQPK
jgi:protocatechuate 3,4-dioxygenase beta subunit